LRTPVPYSGYLEINFTATEQTGWLLSYSSINSTFWDATYYDTNLIYDLWIGACLYAYGRRIPVLGISG